MHLEKETYFGESEVELELGIDDEEELDVNVDEHLALQSHFYKLVECDNEVGTCDVKEIVINGMKDVADVQYLADIDSQGFINAVSELITITDIEDISRLYFIKELQIKEEYRNKGYGRVLLRAVMRDIYMNTNDDVTVVLEACPFITEGNDEERIAYENANIDRLTKFYNKEGFERIRDTKYMYLI